MSGSRSFLQLGALSAGVMFSVLAAASAAAQDCPASRTGKTGFVLERGELQKTEVFHVDGGNVRAVTRVGGAAAVLEITEYQGLFQLERLDRGVRTRYEPQTDLKRLFPLKPGRTVTAAFATESNGQRSTLSVELAVKGMDAVWIGPCKYTVLKIDRTESVNGGPPHFVDTDYYSPELKYPIAKEWRSSGGTHTNKYDRIRSLAPGRDA